jgi:DEAD/DEAH box helicase domain-containing protein
MSGTEPARVVVLDLETLRGAAECGGWRFVERFGLAVAVTWSAADGYREWHEPEAAALVAYLAGFERIVGYNLLHFDYRVLRAYVPDVESRLRPATLDLLDHLHRALGFRVSLDRLAAVNLNRRKSGDGLQCVQRWREGRRDLVVSYCRDDVALTRDLYELGRTRRLLTVPGRRGLAVAVSW